jgi:glutaconate CoA-transferase subunit A
MTADSIESGPWRRSVAELMRDIGDGQRVGVCGFNFTRLPIAQLRELRSRRRLTYISWGGGLPLELLLDSGAVSAAELTFSSLDLFGLAPRFRVAAEDGRLVLHEWTALGMIKAFQARSQHLGFEVMQQVAGSDIGGRWSRPLDDPFGSSGVPQAAVPSLQLDVFLLHASRADDAGNVEIRGARGLDVSAAFAADRVLVTVERRVRAGELGAPGAFVLPRTFVSGVALAPFGAYPSSCLPDYPADLGQIARIVARGTGSLSDDLLEADAETRSRLRRMSTATSSSLMQAVAEVGRARARTGSVRRDELMVCELARSLDATSVATIGSASVLPTAAYLLAKLCHSPELLMLSFNGGLVDVGWRPMTLSFAELLDFRSAVTHAGGDDTYHWYYQQSRVTHEVVGTAQVDPSGASNTIAIKRADGGTVRLPGQGGMADVANLHVNHLMYLPRHSRRNTVASVDVRGASRVWHDAEVRRRFRLSPGRTALYSELGVFEFDPGRGSLVLTRVPAGVEVSEIEARTGWPLAVAEDLRALTPPSDSELAALRERVDPLDLRRLEFAPANERQTLIEDVLAVEQRVLERALELDGARPQEHQHG